MIVVRSTPVRSGMSLLEVLVALAIFLFSLVAIGQLIDTGARAAIEIDYRSHGAMLAQSKLAEVTAGAVALNSQGNVAFEEDPDWSWSLEAEADSTPGLYKVRVTVSREDKTIGKTEVSLSQYVLDPKKRGGTDASVLGNDVPQ